MKTYTARILILVLFVITCLQVSADAQQEGNARINELLKKLEAAEKEDSNRIKLLTALSYEYNKISPYDGIKYGIEALSLCEEQHWEKGVARANSAIGANYFSLSDFPNAYKYWLTALTINEEQGFNQGIANHLHNIGNIYFSQKNYTEALAYYTKALQLGEKTGNKGLATHSYTAIGNVYAQMKDYQQALEYHFKALALDEENLKKSIGKDADEGQNPKGNIAADKLNIGSVYDDQGNYDKALEVLFEALAIKKEIGDKNGLARTYNLIGKVSLDIAESPADETSGKTTKGAKEASLRQAVAYLDSAVTIDKEIGHLDNLQKSYQYLSDAREMLNEPAEALGDYKRSVVIKDSIFSLERHTDIFNLQKKEEIEEKKREMEKQKEESERREYLQICGVCGFIVIFIFAILLMRHKKVDTKIIDVLGTLSVLIIFDFVQLLLHAQIEEYTHHNLVLTLICLLVMASIIIPFHHRIEHWVKAKIGHHKDVEHKH